MNMPKDKFRYKAFFFMMYSLICVLYVTVKIILNFFSLFVAQYIFMEYLYSEDKNIYYDNQFKHKQANN